MTSTAATKKTLNTTPTAANIDAALDNRGRCRWCLGEPLYIAYHDQEWGVPERDRQKLFAFLCLEGAQAGLSWITILRRREAYYAAFANFDIDTVARMTEADVERIMATHNVIKHRGKLLSVISNAQAVLAMEQAGINFSEFLWQFAPPAATAAAATIPAATAESKAMSRALKQRGFKFVGETICYAFMQAMGMVNDHVTDCYRFNEIARLR